MQYLVAIELLTTTGINAVIYYAPTMFQSVRCPKGGLVEILIKRF
jgi:hypothetical protein